MRFTIRDLVWLTVVVALAVLLGIEYLRSPTRRLEFRAEVMEEALKKEGWIIEQPSDWEVKMDNNRTGVTTISLRFDTHGPGPSAP